MPVGGVIDPSASEGLAPHPVAEPARSPCVLPRFRHAGLEYLPSVTGIRALVIAAAMLCAGCTMGSPRAPAADSATAATAVTSATSVTESQTEVSEDSGEATSTTTVGAMDDATSGTAGSTSTTARPSVTDSSTGPASSSMTPPATSTATLPGGTAGRLELEKYGWLDDEGRFTLTRRNAEAVIDADATRSVCSYLFGTTATVAELALLPADSELDAMSGPQITDDALLVACVYDVAGAPALVMQAGTGPAIDPDLPGRPTIVTVGEVQAVFSYAPGRSGLATSVARQWMQQAAARLSVP